MTMLPSYQSGRISKRPPTRAAPIETLGRLGEVKRRDMAIAKKYHLGRPLLLRSVCSSIVGAIAIWGICRYSI